MPRRKIYEDDFIAQLADAVQQIFRKWESENCGPAEEYAYRWCDPRRNFPGDYEDYIEYAELLEYDLNNLDVLYPRNFRKAHDEAYKIISLKTREFKDSELPQIARQYAGYKKLYGFEDKNLSSLRRQGTTI